MKLLLWLDSKCYMKTKKVFCNLHHLILNNNINTQLGLKLIRFSIPNLVTNIIKISKKLLHSYPVCI